MLRLWGIWVIASTIAGVVMGLRRRMRMAIVTGALAGAVALAFNLFQGDGALSSFWSMVAAGGGMLVGGLTGAAVMSVVAGSRPGR